MFASRAGSQALRVDGTAKPRKPVTQKIASWLRCLANSGLVPVRMMDGGHHPAPREFCASCDVSVDRNFIVICLSSENGVP